MSALDSTPGVHVIATGNIGPPGPAGPAGPQGPPGRGWVPLTQQQYDQLPVKDPDTLYVIVAS